MSGNSSWEPSIVSLLFRTVCCSLGAIAAVLLTARGEAATSETLSRSRQPVQERGSATWYEDVPVTKTLSKLLPPGEAKPPSGYYVEIPPPLEPAVRALVAENYARAEVILAEQLASAQSDRERARILMWLGLSAGQEALDQPDNADSGTSAVLYLVQAMRLDPQVREAPDVVRTLADMAGLEYGLRDTPEAPRVLEEAVEKAESSGNPLDYFYAGAMARRKGIIAWRFGREEQFNRLSHRMLMTAVEKDPTRYEFWTLYLPQMQPVELHAHMTSESVGMYRYFKSLRHPLLIDQGPAQLHIRTREGFTIEDEDRLLVGLAEKYPDDPYPTYQLARWAIETTPSLALQRFERFLADWESGKIRPRPKEEGYRVSALYELGFLSEAEGKTTQALAYYDRVREISPTYAQVNGNRAGLYAKLAEEQTTGPEKLRLLELAQAANNEQAKVNYLGKAKERVSLMRRYLGRAIQATRREMAIQGGSAAGTSGGR